MGCYLKGLFLQITELVSQMENGVAEAEKTDFDHLRKNPRPLSEAEDIFPCLLVIAGSSFANWKVGENPN